MDNEKYMVTVAAVAVVAISVAIATAYCISWKMVVDGGYEQRTVPGHGRPVWVRVDSTIPLDQQD